MTVEQIPEREKEKAAGVQEHDQRQVRGYSYTMQGLLYRFVVVLLANLFHRRPTVCCCVRCSDSVAKTYLEKFSWDLMRAVDEFYATGGESLKPVCVHVFDQIRGNGYESNMLTRFCLVMSMRAVESRQSPWKR